MESIAKEYLDKCQARCLEEAENAVGVLSPREKSLMRMAFEFGVKSANDYEEIVKNLAIRRTKEVENDR